MAFRYLVLTLSSASIVPFIIVFPCQVVGIESIVAALQRNTALTALNLAGNGIDEHDLTRLVAGWAV